MKKHAICLFCAVLALYLPFSSALAAELPAAMSSYGVLIADSKGAFSFYDLNGKKGDQRIEIAQRTVMVPIKLLCSFMPDVDYSYDFGTGQAVLRNKKMGTRLIYVKDKKTAVFYGKNSKKGINKGLRYKMYLSKDSNAAMADAASLKWIMGNGGGFLSAGKAAMEKAGYAGSAYKGILAFQPYKKLTVLPKALNVRAHPIKTASNITKITIPEGYSAAQIFDLLTKRGISFSKDTLFAACDKMDVSGYELAGLIEGGAGRCFRLEGYLYPDTYEFYKNSPPEEIIGKLLANTDRKIKAADRILADDMGYSADEILTIASIIEKETGDKAQMPYVASVLYNRLNQKMKLQCDASIYYVERYVKPYISGDKNRYNAFYNTNKCPALPAGPICSPGANALYAALHPAETDYLYFCSDSDGAYYYAATYEEHLKNLEVIQ